MDTMTAAEAKQKFGELLDKAQRGPVAITKHGKRVGVFVPAETYHLDNLHREKWIAEKLAKSRKDAQDGNVTRADVVREEMRAFLDELDERAD